LSGHQAFRSTRQVNSFKIEMYCSNQIVEEVIGVHCGFRFNPWRGFFPSQYYRDDQHFSFDRVSA
jgi:hypothetical protein